MNRFLPIPALAVVGLVTLFRVYAAAVMPLNDDEMYYWVWSIHPAFGYVDHPPAVAWLIAAGSFLGRTPLAIRLPFILCEALAALAIGRAARALGASMAGAGAAAIIFAAIPQPELFIAQAKPNAPYLLCWALALIFAARCKDRVKTSDAVWLGLALAGAVLSRFFGWALVLGIILWALSAKTALARALAIPLAIVAALYAPFVYWNATHRWINFAFTLFARHDYRAHAWVFDSVHGIRFALYAIAFIALALVTARGRSGALVRWTALPAVIAFSALSLIDNVETYWLLGPFTSLCATLGPWVLSLRRPIVIALSTLWIAAAAFTMATIAYTSVTETGPLGTRDFFNRRLAADTRALLAGRDVRPITDTYQIAGTLQYYGIRTLMIGDSSQAVIWREWYGAAPGPRALLLTLEPLAATPALRAELERQFSRLRPVKILRYGTLPGPRVDVYATWCDNGPDGSASVRTPTRPRMGTPRAVARPHRAARIARIGRSRTL